MPKAKTYTLDEIRRMAEEYNNMRWAYPSLSQKQWVDGFVERIAQLERDEQEKRNGETS